MDLNSMLNFGYDYELPVDFWSQNADRDLQDLPEPFRQLWNPELNGDISVEGIENIAHANFYNMQEGVDLWAHPENAEASPESSEQTHEHQSSATLISSEHSEQDDSVDEPSSRSVSIEDESEGERICYGMMYQQDVKLSDQNMPELSSKLRDSQANDSPDQAVQTFAVEAKPDHILLLFRDGVSFGLLRDNMFKSLGPILERERALRLEGVAITKQICERIAKINKSSDRVIQMDINVYGLRQDANRIGEELSTKKIWLQRPDKARLPYENPHVISFPGMEQATISASEIQANSGAKKPQDEEERVRQIVSDVHDSLQRANELETTIGDRRLKTKLLKHQQRALTFMKQRESGVIPEKYRLWKKSSVNGQEMYVHRVTKTRSTLQPEEKGGGILADEMGMGKSLCLLALVLETLDEGRKWAEEKQQEEHHGSTIQGYSHSTLIIVPSALLINNWLKEIRTHLDGILKVIKYHGQNRERDLDMLKNSDVIVTTYSTLAVECSNRKSQLDKIGWFRVVLDEAHVIRRPATTFYRTCMELEARSRWCLTGTPIQNRLQDIGALFAFLRAEPFHAIAQFRRFIVVPFDQGDPVVKDRLVMLYDSLCLRRTKDILTLPGVEERTRKLEFSPEERRHYEGTVKILDRSIREKVGQFEQVSKFGLFQAHLQLRILCNHGTYQKPFSWKRNRLRDINESLTAEVGMDLEIRCGGCEQLKPFVGSRSTSTKGDCGHYLCSACQGDLESYLGPLDSSQCLLCVQRRGVGLIHRAGAHASNLDSLDEMDQEETEQPQQDGTHSRDEYFNENGFSVKMKALVKDVKEDKDKMKSIVFSCWTRTLDLVERHLKAEGIENIRIDGNTLMSERQRRLDQFERESGARVLLMTTGTGAFGLNITAAKRVFIVELQWNPSVENQAIARTIRLGQEENVLVIRYMIRNTVEEEMQSQQKNKRNVAKLGW